MYISAYAYLVCVMCVCVGQYICDFMHVCAHMVYLGCVMCVCGGMCVVVCACMCMHGICGVCAMYGVYV